MRLTWRPPLDRRLLGLLPCVCPPRPLDLYNVFSLTYWPSLTLSPGSTMTDTSPSMASADPALLDTEAMDVVADAPPTPTPPTKPSGPHPRSSPRPKHPPIPAEISSRKTIYLIRHGVSRHNHHNISLTSPSLTDASLDTVGLHQATAMGARYRYAVGEVRAHNVGRTT